MGKSRLSTLAAQRCSFTGEGQQKSYTHIQALGPGARSIPEASDHQAMLETLVLLELGRQDPKPWKPGDPFYGIYKVTPHQDDLIMHVARRYRPDLIAALLPHLIPGDGDVPEEIVGICGLRFSFDTGHVILRRPGVDGKIRIPMTEPEWRTAVLVTLHERHDNPDGAWYPWLGSPDEWTEPEARYLTEYQIAHRLALGPQPLHRLASDLFRRLPGLFQPLGSPDFLRIRERLNGDLEFNWSCGPRFPSVIDRLLAPDTGLRAEVAPDQHCLCECCERRFDYGVIRLRSLDGTDEPLHLVRDSIDFNDDNPFARVYASFVEARKGLEESASGPEGDRRWRALTSASHPAAPCPVG